MIIRAKEIKTKGDETKFTLTGIAECLMPRPNPLNLFSIVRVAPGEEVPYHVHEGENETYYILEGKALYDDNGTKVEVSVGDTTFTPGGEGHGIKNIGNDTLVFVALIIKE